MGTACLLIIALYKVLAPRCRRRRYQRPLASRRNLLTRSLASAISMQLLFLDTPVWTVASLLNTEPIFTDTSQVGRPNRTR